ncbi:MAG TPA: putative oxidoreductase C-terminal domain-containing protein [Burkholderiales bacterium]|nr:putative oxidoreductase C-terminal domain-containing protein [Burkholderiales bacterium]
MSASQHTAVVLNPGHFHAALTLRQRHARLSDDVYVYAEEGSDVESFLRIVRTFNDRAQQPTGWRLHVYRGPDYLERMLAERPGEVAIVAGRNDVKMRCIHRLHADGLLVLGDKPWLIHPGELTLLKETATTPPLAMDIMTERHEITSRLQKALMANPEVFGRLRTDGSEPAIHIRSVHHLYKIVNQRPLVRPAWYFDTAVQGEGIMDVTTHLVDLVQWMAGGGEPFRYPRDVELISARQWPTDVPRDMFARITGLEDFPAALRSRVSGGVLRYLCNAEIAYRLRGVPVLIESRWDLAIPEGGGDTHFTVVRGTRADLVVEQGPETGFQTSLVVRPVGTAKGFEDALAGAARSLQPSFPGLAFERAGEQFRASIPAALRTTHEEHFAAVLEEFLACIDGTAALADLGADLVSKYTLLAHSAELSHRPA